MSDKEPFTPAEWDTIYARCPMLNKYRERLIIEPNDRAELVREQLSVQEAAMEKSVTGSIRFWAAR